MVQAAVYFLRRHGRRPPPDVFRQGKVGATTYGGPIQGESNTGEGGRVNSTRHYAVLHRGLNGSTFRLDITRGSARQKL